MLCEHLTFNHSPLWLYTSFWDKSLGKDSVFNYHGFATSQALPYPTSLAMMNIKMSMEELFSFRSQRTFGPCEVPPTIPTHLSSSYTCQAWRGSLILPQTHPTPQHTPPNPEYSRFNQLKIKVVLLPIESHGDIGHRATDTRPASTVFQPRSTKARRALCTSFMLCT